MNYGNFGQFGHPVAFGEGNGTNLGAPLGFPLVGNPLVGNPFLGDMDMGTFDIFFAGVWGAAQGQQHGKLRRHLKALRARLQKTQDQNERQEIIQKIRRIRAMLQAQQGRQGMQGRGRGGQHRGQGRGGRFARRRHHRRQQQAYSPVDEGAEETYDYVEGGDYEEEGVAGWLGGVLGDLGTLVYDFSANAFSGAWEFAGDLGDAVGLGDFGVDLNPFEGKKGRRERLQKELLDLQRKLASTKNEVKRAKLKQKIAKVRKTLAKVEERLYKKAAGKRIDLNPFEGKAARTRRLAKLKKHLKETQLDRRRRLPLKPPPRRLPPPFPPARPPRPPGPGMGPGPGAPGMGPRPGAPGMRPPTRAFPPGGPGGMDPNAAMDSEPVTSAAEDAELAKADREAAIAAGEGDRGGLVKVGLAILVVGGVLYMLSRGGGRRGGGGGGGAYYGGVSKAERRATVKRARAARPATT